VAVALWVNKLHKTNREDADAATWANEKLPLFYEQADASEKCELMTVELYENALKKLEEHGNQWLGRTREEREKNVYLWIWGKDEQMTSPNFTKWRLAKMETRKDIVDAYIAEKARNAKREGLADLVKTYAETADFDDIEKQN
jgi:hypothetical protein